MEMEKKKGGNRKRRKIRPWAAKMDMTRHGETGPGLLLLQGVTEAPRTMDIPP